jgi:hypothetical protein
MTVEWVGQVYADRLPARCADGQPPRAPDPGG